jgi:hypothetical protein
VNSSAIWDKKRFYIKQGVTLTGLSTGGFEKAASICTDIYAKMSGYFPEDKMNHWENATYEGHSATNFSARYFTSRADAKHEANLPFLEGVDPDGVLEKLRRQDLIHGPDNQVPYLDLDQKGGCILHVYWVDVRSKY